MSLATNYDKINFATQYTYDKIVGVFTGSYNLALQPVIGGFLQRYTIPHSFGRPVFTDLLWSPDGVTYVDGSSGSTSMAYSDSNNIYILTTYPVGMIYYKVIATWIDDYDGTNPAIEPQLSTTDGIYFDTRSNYQKTYLQSSFTVTGPAPPFQTIAHNLGYTPNAKIYFESLSGQVWPAMWGGTNNQFLYDFANQYECTAIINSTNMVALLLGGASAVSARAWYRIYLDQ
jgi:hypothetical protein